MSKKSNPCSYVLPCRSNTITLRKVKGREQITFDALPRYVTYSFMPPAYYAKGYHILPEYKTQFDFTEMRKLLFLEDKEKWGSLRARLPYPEQRVLDLPGTRDLDYKNYCLRSLTPESAMSWRKSIATPAVREEAENNRGLTASRAIVTLSWFLEAIDRCIPSEGSLRFKDSPEDGFPVWEALIDSTTMQELKYVVSGAVCCSNREKPLCNNKNCPYK